MADYLDFEIELLDMPPPRITRRFLLTSKATSMLDLHHAIQRAAGWLDYHLFAFHSVGGEPFASCEHDEGAEARTARSIKLSSVFHEDGEFSLLYNYDYGDDWWVLVRFNGSVNLPEAFFRKLVGGDRGWPPNDCGGPHAFRELLDARRRSAAGIRLDEEQRSRLEWAGTWQDAFDIEKERQTFYANP